MAAVKHAVYTGIDARGYTLLKCLCGFEVVRPTEDEARADHADAIKKTRTAKGVA